MVRQLLLQLLISITLLSTVAAKDYDLVVAADGSGDFYSIQEAIEACRAFQTKEKSIYIKKGVYREKVVIQHFRSHISLIGECADSTIIEWRDYAGMDGIGTFNSYTLKIEGDDIKISNLTIKNGAGPVGQAVALHIEGDRCIVKGCNIFGHQDTLYLAGERCRQCFFNCKIVGTTDFIFGGATSYFEGCEIVSLSDSYITAASTNEHKPYGFVFYKCTLLAPDSVSKVYLGRPWRPFAQTVFISCNMGKHIRPEGWHNWGNEANEATVLYAEYDSRGEGAIQDDRVKWCHNYNKKDISRYNIEYILAPIAISQGRKWWRN